MDETSQAKKDVEALKKIFDEFDVNHDGQRPKFRIISVTKCDFFRQIVIARNHYVLSQIWTKPDPGRGDATHGRCKFKSYKA